MPTYTYRCQRCGEVVERVQSMSDPPLRRCPACRALRLQRVFHPVGIVLKGPGFHKTDYGRSSGKGSEEAKEKPASRTDDTKKTAASE